MIIEIFFQLGGGGGGCSDALTVYSVFTGNATHWCGGSTKNGSAAKTYSKKKARKKGSRNATCSSCAAHREMGEGGGAGKLETLVG